MFTTFTGSSPLAVVVVESIVVVVEVLEVGTTGAVSVWAAAAFTASYSFSLVRSKRCPKTSRISLAKPLHCASSLTLVSALMAFDELQTLGGHISDKNSNEFIL